MYEIGLGHTYKCASSGGLSKASWKNDVLSQPPGNGAKLPVSRVDDHRTLEISRSLLGLLVLLLPQVGKPRHKGVRFVAGRPYRR